MRINRPYNPHPRNITVDLLKGIYSDLGKVFVEPDLGQLRREFFLMSIREKSTPMWWPADFDHINTFEKWATYKSYMLQTDRLTYADCDALVKLYEEKTGSVNLPAPMRRNLTITRALAKNPTIRPISEEYRYKTFCEYHPSIARVCTLLGAMRTSLRDDVIYSMLSLWDDWSPRNGDPLPLTCHAYQNDADQWICDPSIAPQQDSAVLLDILFEDAYSFNN